MRRRMSHPTSDVPNVTPWRAPSWPAVILAISAVTVVVVSTLVRDAVSSPVWLVTVVVVAGSWWVLRRRTRAIAETSTDQLDERDLAIRNVAAWWGQTAMFSLGAVAALMLMVAARLNLDSADTVLLRAGGIVLSLVILSAAVPTFVVSLLTEPDEHLDFDDEDDEDDE